MEMLRQIHRLQRLDFSNYWNTYSRRVEKPTRDFLEWFIGFSEGDGSFICTTQGRNIFTIVQAEAQVLRKLRTQLGFGRVRKRGAYWEYTVADKGGVERLLSIFNGNLLLGKTAADFNKWMQFRRQNGNTSPDPIDNLRASSPLLAQGGWLSGFIDAEGCFYAEKTLDPRYSLGYRVRLRFTLDQRDEEYLLFVVEQLLGSGTRYIRRKAQADPELDTLMWRLDVTQLDSLAVLLGYLHRYPLRSQKSVDRMRFFRLYNAMRSRKEYPWEGKTLLRVENLLARLDCGKASHKPFPAKGEAKAVSS